MEKEGTTFSLVKGEPLNIRVYSWQYLLGKGELPVPRDD